MHSQWFLILHRVAYTKLGQKLSVANFWNGRFMTADDNISFSVKHVNGHDHAVNGLYTDPFQQERYKKYNEFLPVLNEDASSSMMKLCL